MSIKPSFYLIVLGSYGENFVELYVNSISSMRVFFSDLCCWLLRVKQNNRNFMKKFAKKTAEDFNCKTRKEII
ncbi:hypothetical protein CWS01_18715 [Niallia nealsonii]|uniref:Uncharacterized protein n=1 Tax=Niallia nealsonii TaxID=115979 RepID=A0A2N0YY41_9BACI|nr:hypothetical protein CWS01_18715 [Niallia nealsonii]